MEIPLYAQSDSLGRMIEVIRDPYGMKIVFEQKEQPVDWDAATRFK